ncbi:MAG: ATP-binding protein [Bacteroidetes bacterium]|nr:ATP-binding protein [Bacteroidota bacterium]
MIKPPKTYAELLALIYNKVEESHNLEYKSADALLQIGNKGGSKDGAVELIKDVSAMANSAGGVIIYGIKEFNDIECKHLPEKVTPIKRQDFSKERIEQLLNGNIMPKIEGLLIHPIELENVNEVAYAIEVPQSHTAQQNTKDKRYYKRQNFEAVAMLDYEVRDVMNRGTYPQLTLDIEIVTGVNEPRYWQKDLEYKTEYYLSIRIKNTGTVFASYVNYFVEINGLFLKQSNYKVIRREANGEEFIEYYGENTIRDIVDTEITAAGAVPKLGPSRFDPILPKMQSRAEKLKINTGENPRLLLKSFSDSIIRWRIYADNAPEQTGQIRIGSLPGFKQIVNS